MSYYFNIIQTKSARTLAGPFRDEDERQRYEEQTNELGITVVGKCVIDVATNPPTFKFTEVF